METIISYIENIFKNYPDIPEIAHAKTELLNVMEDKYNELKSQGKSENEVIGIVISEFGSIDEIVAELNLKEESDKDIYDKNNEETDLRPIISVTGSQAEEFIQKRIYFGNMIALGVALCILSPITSIILEELSGMGVIKNTLSEAIGATVLLVIIAIAVSILVFNGIAYEKYEHYHKERIILDNNTRNEIERKADLFRPVFNIKITVGIVLCIVSVIPSIILDEIGTTDFMQKIVDMSSVFILVVIAAAVSLFITSSIRKDAYNIILNKEEYGIKQTENSNKAKRIISIIAVIYWPIILVIFIVWSFWSANWGITWIIWPIAGIIFGSLAAAINLIFTKKI